MSMFDLHQEPGSTIYDWPPELASTIATRLHDHHPALRRLDGSEGRTRLQQKVESLLAHLSTAMRLEQPGLFADFVSRGDALPAIIRLSLADYETVLRLFRNALRQYLPGPRGELAVEYINFAKAHQSVPERIAA